MLTGRRIISSVALESVLTTHPDVLEAGVVSVADKNLGERPKAYVTARSGTHIDGKELIDWVKNKNEISKFMVPREVEIVEELPMTIMGKPKKSIMREWAKGGEKRMP
jgi:acyl-coenzyme A synthetase/AMP-(fatty) acid ligase